jgi:protein involved in polysaccharide export with SLBB domain
VGVDVERALERPGSGDDLVLEDGDVVIVPRLDPTVTIRGQVAFESQVRFRQGLSLDDYLEAAGGVMASGDRRRASVEYPNGERQVVRNRRFWPDRQPTVQPGSVIVVPERDPDETGTNWGGLISQVVQTASSVITILVLVNQLNSP